MNRSVRSEVFWLRGLRQLPHGACCPGLTRWLHVSRYISRFYAGVLSDVSWLFNNQASVSKVK